ncbi:MAG: ABC transporter substrate-binding protein, partial [Comamonadaceae bacterium]
MLKACGLAWVFSVLCTGLAQAVTVRDDRQQEVSFSQAPVRIVSLLPSLTETVCALGQCRKLVGLDRYSNWPASIRQLPRLGG